MFPINLSANKKSFLPKTQSQSLNSLKVFQLSSTTLKTKFKNCLNLSTQGKTDFLFAGLNLNTIVQKENATQMQI